MPAYDLIIRNGKIVTGRGLVESDVCISDGKITTLKKNASGSSSNFIDARNMLLFPGLIDPHVHFRDPGLTHKEDFLSGSKGAAAGGTTTIFDMPTTQPVVSNAELFREKIDVVKGKALANYGLIAAASNENLSDIPKLAETGAIAFKTYMVSPPKERTNEYAGSFITNSGELYQTMEAVTRTGLVHCVHAESDSVVACLTEKLQAEGRKDPMAHYDSRPNFAEAEAVYSALLLSEVLRTKLHVVHVSTSEAVQLLFEARRRGVDASSETCPHYLCFSKEILTEKGPFAKYNPPARNKNDVTELLSALNEGTIDMVSTDHAPHALEEKERGNEDIFRAPPGTPGVETRLPILLKMARDGRLRLKDIPRLTSEAQAKRFNLYPKKGSIRVGSDADIAIVDYKREWRIKASELQTKAWETVLFDGMRVTGRVKYTILNGEVAFEDGAGFPRAGIGQFVHGSPSK
jgi:allantoinase